MGAYNNKAIRQLKDFEYYQGKILGIYSSNTLITSLQDGNKYLVGSNATNLFLGKENNIAIYNIDGSYTFISPIEGMQLFLNTDKKVYYYIGGIWQENNSSGIDTDDFISKNGDTLEGDLIIANGVVIKPATPEGANLGELENPFGSVFVGSDSLYVDGNEVISSTENTIDISTTNNQHLVVNTSGLGTTRISSGKEVILYSSQDLNIQSLGDMSTLSSGRLSFTTDTSGDDLVFEAKGTLSDINFKSVHQINLDCSDINFTSTPKINGVSIGTDSQKLNNQSASYYLDRTNHTGTQSASTIAGLATVATSGSYNNLGDKPTIPTTTSQLTNNSGFITSADIPVIPTKTSQLTNDSSFITNSDIPYIPTKVSDLTNDSGFITSSSIPSTYNANNINVSTTNFNKNLSSSETNLQLALDKIDDFNLGSGSSSIKVGSDTLTGTIEFIEGSNIDLTVDNVNNTITISSTGGSGSSIDDVTSSLTTTYSSSNIESKLGNKQDLNKIGTDDFDATNKGNGRAILYNSNTGNFECANINIAGIIGSSGMIQASGSPISISSNQEILVNFPETTNNKINVQIIEKIDDSIVINNSNDFSSNTNYVEQDSTKTSFSNGALTLKNTNNSLATDLKAIYRLNDADNTTAYDDSGNNNNAIMSNTSSVAGKYGNARTITSADNNSYIYKDGILSTYTNFTICGWYKVTAGTIKTTVYSNYMSCMTTKSGGVGLALGVSTDGYYSINFYNTSHIQVKTSVAVTSNWVHLALVKSGTTATLYVNGTSSATTSAIASNSGLNYRSCYYSASNYVGVGFSMDDVGIWERALTSDEISYIYNLNMPINIYTYPTTPYYVYNKYFINLALTKQINNVNITQTTPTNTSIKYLVTFDSGSKWLYYNNGWHITVDTTLGQLLNNTTSFTNGNSYTDIQTYFSNKTISTITSDLSSLSISPSTLGFAFLLNSTDVSVTPTLDLISLNHTLNTYYQTSSIGRPTDTNVDYGVKFVNSTSMLIVKNNSGTSSIIPNIIIGTT